jgi:hypothetical protein
MPYHTLGARPVQARADTTGLNTGNWTAVLDGQVITSTVPVFELYHIYLTAPTLTGAPTTATVMLNLMHWDITLIGQANSWDPSQPMLLQPGDTLFVMFNVPVTTTPPPTVTGWFRYQT